MKNKKPNIFGQGFYFNGIKWPVLTLIYYKCLLKPIVWIFYAKISHPHELIQLSFDSEIGMCVISIWRWNNLLEWKWKTKRKKKKKRIKKDLQMHSIKVKSTVFSWLFVVCSSMLFLDRTDLLKLCQANASLYAEHVVVTWFFPLDPTQNFYKINKIISHE